MPADADTRHARNRAPREVAILVYPGVQSLDVTGPLEVFTGAQQLLDAEATGHGGARSSADRDGRRATAAAGDGAGRSGRAAPRERGYRVLVLSRDGAPVETSSGLTIVPHGALAQAPDVIDTLIVAGGQGVHALCEDRATLDWIVARAGDARRVASVCTGAFALAAAGLLDGRRAATHWAAAAELARRYPRVHVEPEPIFVRDGSVWTSAGVSAGMDLALALVEDDLDRDAALTIARHLVLFLRRPGNQSQFSATLAAQAPRRDALRDVQRFAVENLAADLSVEALAARAHMSARHFARSFRAETGSTPARYVERLRLEAARRALEDAREPLAATAAACGFGTPETMRRVFLRALGVGPAEYRRRFQRTIDRAAAASA
ncbi:MAG TPA: DJ-1/PfpI family protein [Solirubrobacteraceae bacterium]|jgi:transcriptional regulator GlxA family with amidase domain|nr:DJ-1/PfpI family protein [Solirubrobacteraceae bacterium]